LSRNRVSREEVESVLLNVVSQCSPCSFKEIREHLEKIFAGRILDWRVVRRVLADLVKEGKIRRKPDYEKRVIVYFIGD
jgi:hypothetical protein